MKRDSISRDEAVGYVTEMFHRYGYDRCTINLVVTETPLSRSSFYYNFEDKAYAFRKAAFRCVSNLTFSSIFLFPDRISEFAQIVKIYEGAIDLFLRNDPPGCLIFSRVGPSSDPVAVALLRFMKELLAGLLKEELAEIAPASRCESAAKLMILHYGALARWADDGQDRSFLLKQAARFVEDVAVIVGLSHGTPALDYCKLAEKPTYSPKNRSSVPEI